MMKKILGSIVVASALFLTACGYTPAEQKFYDACVKLEPAAIKTAAKSHPAFKGISLSGSDAKSLCDSAIKEINKKAKEAKMKQSAIDKMFEMLAKGMKALGGK